MYGSVGQKRNLIHMTGRVRERLENGGFRVRETRRGLGVSTAGACRGGYQGLQQLVCGVERGCALVKQLARAVEAAHPWRHRHDPQRLRELAGQARRMECAGAGTRLHDDNGVGEGD